jgi:hypothetical protein
MEEGIAGSVVERDFLADLSCQVIQGCEEW